MCHVAFNLLHRLDDHSTMNFPMLKDGESTSIVEHLCSHLIVDDQKQEIFVPEFIFVHRNCYNKLLLKYQTTNGKQDKEECGIDTEGEREADNEDKEGDKTTNSTVDNDNTETECSDGGDDGSKHFDEIQTMLRTLIASSTTTTTTTCEMTEGLLEKLRIGLDGSYNVKVSSI